MLQFNAPRSRTALSNDVLAKVAPAIFAQAPHDKLSERYAFYPTIAVVDALRGAGWFPVQAMQSRARDVSRYGLQKHVVRFQHADSKPVIDGLHPELVLKNSHDGSSAYDLMCGLFRLVCSNGLIIQSANFGDVKVRHTGYKPEDVVEASFKVVQAMPQLGESVEAMRAVTLAPEERTILAESAALIRWGDQASTPVEPRRLLETRRYEDRSPDLWTTFNTIQENVVQGGARGRNAAGARRTVRGIASVSEDTRINRALWHLAEQMRVLKTGTGVAA